jgi:hypothetical protein
VALRRLSNSSIQTNGKSSKLWDQTTFQSGMFALATVSLISNQTSIAFSGIPSNYNHLQLRIFARMNRADTADNIAIRLNNDTGSNYSWHELRGDGSGGGSTGGGNQSYMYVNDIAANSAAANVYGSAIIDIVDYSSTSKFKTIRALSGRDNNSDGGIAFQSGNWRNSADAVSTITLTGRYGSGFLSGAHVALYGIKAS